MLEQEIVLAKGLIAATWMYYLPKLFWKILRIPPKKPLLKSFSVSLQASILHFQSIKVFLLFCFCVNYSNCSEQLFCRTPSNGFLHTGHEIWDKVSKNGPSKICRRQPLKNLEGLWSAKSDHTSSNFLKAILHKLCLVHFWILWLNVLFWRYCR